MDLLRRKSGWDGLRFPGVLLLLSLFLAACSSTVPPTGASAFTPVASQVAATSPVSKITVTEDPISLPDAHIGALTAIRMLDTQHGWALTEHAILTTRDGGIRWRNVTPPDILLGPLSRGDFMDSRYAWVVSTQAGGAIFLLRTSDGGQSWQRSSITSDVQSMIGDMPHFRTSQEGWLQIVTHGGPDAGSESVDILHSTDGGQSWHRLASTDQQHSGLPRDGIKTGISFKDRLNGWATGHDASNNVWLYASHDGGQTWHSQTVIDLPGYYSNDATRMSYATTPPVFFGRDGLLPVEVAGQLDHGPQATVHGFILCITHDGGQTWFSNWKTAPYALTTFTTSNLYIADMQHAWASSDDPPGTLYNSSDGGQSWPKIAGQVGPFKAFCFVDMEHGWAIVGNTLVHTSDGGQSWQPVK